MQSVRISIALLAWTAPLHAEPCSKESTLDRCQEGNLRLSIEAGFVVHRFREGPIEDGTIERTTMPGTTQLTAMGPRFRFMFSYEMFYFGGDIDVGDASGPSLARVDPQMPSAPPLVASPGYVAGAAVAGVRTRFDRLTFGGEVSAGGRSIVYDWRNANNEAVGSSFAIDHYELDASARVDWWLHPQITVGASIGTSILGAGDVLFELGIAAHFRAFDGIR